MFAPELLGQANTLQGSKAAHVFESIQLLTTVTTELPRLQIIICDALRGCDPFLNGLQLRASACQEGAIAIDSAIDALE